MCVIIYKPRNIELPDKEILEDCWNSNPHGAGIAIRRKDFIEVHKGFMKKEKMLSFLEKTRKNSKNFDIVIHFRLASRGKISPELCHPFAFSLQNSLRYKTKDPVLFHNGTIFWLGDHEKSDTQEFTEILGYLYEKKVSMKVIKDFIKKFAPVDRFLILTLKKVFLFGNWHFDKETNCYFSNMNWKYPYKI